MRDETSCANCGNAMGYHIVREAGYECPVGQTWFAPATPLVPSEAGGREEDEPIPCAMGDDPEAEAQGPELDAWYEDFKREREEEADPLIAKLREVTSGAKGNRPDYIAMLSTADATEILRRLRLASRSSGDGERLRMLEQYVCAIETRDEDGYEERWERGSAADEPFRVWLDWIATNVRAARAAEGAEP